MKGPGNYSGIMLPLAYLHKAIAEKNLVNKGELNWKPSV